jgi:hypothetical protein
MFSKALSENREAVYAVLTSSPLQPGAITPSIGSAFMISPGLLVTAAHCLDDPSQPGMPPYRNLSVIRAPDIGRKAEPVSLVARDDGKDLALLRIDAPRSSACLKLLDAPVPVGTHCGSSGFPRILVDSAPPQAISLIELFQGAEICAFLNAAGLDQVPVSRYETDSPMYGDAAGCPGFVPSGEVFGMYNRFVPDLPVPSVAPGAQGRHTRTGVSLWVPSMEIIAFAEANGAALPR